MKPKPKANISIPDNLAKQGYIRIIGTDSWPYHAEPHHFYQVWDDYQNGRKRKYPWDNRKYIQQVESDQLIYKYIHHLYSRVTQRNYVQLEIKW